MVHQNCSIAACNRLFIDKLTNLQLCDDQQAGNAVHNPCQCTSFSQEVFRPFVTTTTPVLCRLLRRIPGSSHEPQILLRGLGYDCSTST